MAAVAPSPDKSADLLQKLSLDSEPKAIGVSESATVTKVGPVFSTGRANGTAKPLNPNACFIPNGYPSTAYYYGGYDGQGNDWNVYSRYVNLDGGMAQGVYGDSCTYMYHQGYGYTPYGAYPPPASSAPTMQHDSQLYGLQQYQYPSPYYQSPTSADETFAPNKISAPASQGEIPTAVTADHVRSSVLMNKGNTGSMVNGDCINKNGLKALLTSSQNSSLNLNDPYQRACLPAYVPLSGYQGPRFIADGSQSANLSDASLFFDRNSKHGAKVGLSSTDVPTKDFSSRRNQTLSQPLPQFMNLHGSRPSSGSELVSGFMNRMYPSYRMYGQYGNTFKAGTRFGSAAFGSRTGSVNDKLKVTSNGHGGVEHRKKNMDGYSELTKGPRAKSTDDKSGKGFECVTVLLKGQDLPMRSDNKEVPLVPNREPYNREDFSESYPDARFFVIKSYSEDDIHKSIKYNVWASTPNGNKKLDAAYQEAKEKPGGCPVFLLFSVNISGQFVGLAEMTGSVDFDRSVKYWQQDRWTGCFPVKWHIIKDIPNSVLRHITLENNENKPVTNSRDTQEVKFVKGIQILKIFKEHSSKTCILDDFGFYEAREKTFQERKSKEQELPKQANKPSNLTATGTVILPKSLDGTLINASAAASKVNAEVKPLEENGSTTAFDDSSEAAKPEMVSHKNMAPNGVASVC